jgi:hypothetical protein
VHDRFSGRRAADRILRQREQFLQQPLVAALAHPEEQAVFDSARELDAKGDVSRHATASRLQRPERSRTRSCAHFELAQCIGARHGAQHAVGGEPIEERGRSGREIRRDELHGFAFGLIDRTRRGRGTDCDQKDDQVTLHAASRICAEE